MRRIALALSLVLALSGVAAAEFVAREKDFRCLLDGKKVDGKTFLLFNRNRGLLRKALHLARKGKPGKQYPVGTILQLFPFEAMVASLGLSEETIRALQHDPRCASAP